MRNRSGQFTKGHCLGGRPKGSQTDKVKALVNELNEKTINALLEDFNSLKASDLIKVLNVTLKHTVPQLKAIEANVESENVGWFDLSDELKKELIENYFN